MRWEVRRVPDDAFILGEEAFAAWGRRCRSLVLESFDRMVRRGHGWLTDDAEPRGGRWNLDRENRERPPRDGVDAPHVHQPREDGIDAQLQANLHARG